MVSLEFIYKYLGIDPIPTDCKNRDHMNICRAKGKREGSLCNHSWDSYCEYVDPVGYFYPEYPEPLEISVVHLTMLENIISNGNILQYRHNKSFEKPYSYSIHGIEKIGKTRSEAILLLLEELCKQDKFTEEQKDELFYLVSYM